jgi:hypothetical protein
LTSAQLTREKEENDTLSNKIFVLENILQKKENIIDSLNKKIQKVNHNTSTDSNIVKEKEIFILEPSLAVTQLHDELMLYKKIYQTLTTHITELKASLARYHKLNHDLEQELSKLKQEMKFSTVTINNNEENTVHTPKTVLDRCINQSNNVTCIKNDNSNLRRKSQNMSNIQITPLIVPKKNKSDNNILNYNDKSNQNNNDKSPNTSQIKLNIVKNYEDFEEVNRCRKEKVDLAEEWIETLKNSNMTQDEFVRYSKNKLMSKLVDALEYLYKIIMDKNVQIRILTSEVEDLNMKNMDLNKENMILYETNEQLIREKEADGCRRCEKIRRLNTNSNINTFMTKGDTGMDSSMTNNLSVTVKEKVVNFQNNPYTVTNTLESITSSEFREGISGDTQSFISRENTEIEVQNFVNVQHIKHSEGI